MSQHAMRSSTDDVSYHREKQELGNRWVWSGTEMMVHELAYVPKPRPQTFTGFYTIHIYDGKHEAIKGANFQK